MRGRCERERGLVRVITMALELREVSPLEGLENSVPRALAARPAE